MATPGQRSNGYIGRRLAFIIIWMFAMLLPSGHGVPSGMSPSALAVAAILGLVLTFVPPIIAARQIYKAYTQKQ
jgi:hypothetical protein